jgi:oligopeptidase B
VSSSGSESLFLINWDGTKEMSILPGEEIYLDVNELAKDKSYCSVGSVKISPSGTKIAYSVDYSGDEKYEMHIRDLVTGEDVVQKSENDELLEVDGLEWGKNDDMVYYTTMDDQHRPFRLYQRNLGDVDATTDRLLKEDLDDLYWCGVSKS